MVGYKASVWSPSRCRRGRFVLVWVESAQQVLRALQSTSADAARASDSVEGTRSECASHALGDAVAALQRHALRVGHLSDAEVLIVVRQPEPQVALLLGLRWVL